MSEFKIYGLHPIEEAISLYALNPQDTLYIARKEEARIKRILQKAERGGCKIKIVKYKDLTEICQTKNHQGILLLRHKVPHIPLLFKKEIENEKNFQVYLALDKVQDPQNLGAVLRSAYGLGAKGIILPIRETSPYTPAVMKSSAGAMLKLPVLRISSLANFILSLKEKNPNFIVIGGSLKGEKVDPKFFQKLYEDKKTILLVLGGEEGLSPLVEKRCDFLFCLPIKNSLESYNLSVAGALFLYEILRPSFY